MVLKFTFFQNCSSLFYISQNYIRRFKDTTVFEDVFTEILTQAIRHNLVSGADSIQENNLTHYQSKITLDDLQSKAQMKEHANKALHHTVCYNLNQIIKKEIAKLKQRTAWRIEGTLREFPKFAPVNMWFSFPVHTVDNTGVLSDVDPEDSKPLWQKAQDKKKLSAKKEKEQRKQEFELAIEACCMGEPPTKEDVATYLDISVKTVERRLRDTKRYIFDKNLGKIIKTDKDK